MPLPCACPDCGGDVERTGDEFVTRTELPRVQPRVIPYRVHARQCRGCGRKVRGEHEDVTSRWLA